MKYSQLGADIIIKEPATRESGCCKLWQKDKIKQGEMLMQKNYYADKKLHLESISLVQNPVSAWCKILLETSLADCFFLDYCTV